MNDGFAEMVRSVLSDTSSLPPEFLSFLTQHQTQNPVSVQATISPTIIASGVGTSSQAPSRYVGATAFGPPTSGTYVVGDFVIDNTGAIWICIVRGTPGTWNRPGAVSQTPITTTGTTTYTTPSGCWAILIECIGAGAGGAGCAASGATTQCAIGSGGGGGAYSASFVTDPAVSYSVTVGTGGNGGAAGNNSGVTGGTTSFGAISSAQGGIAGSSTNAIAGGTAIAAAFGSGGGLASGSSGTLKIDGGSAAPSIRLSGSIGMSYGGGSPRSAMPVYSFVNVAGTGSGQGASNFGGGGAGAVDTNNVARAGGSGAQGIIIVTEFH